MQALAGDPLREEEGAVDHLSVKIKQEADAGACQLMPFHLVNARRKPQVHIVLRQGENRCRLLILIRVVQPFDAGRTAGRNDDRL